MQYRSYNYYTSTGQLINWIRPPALEIIIKKLTFSEYKTLFYLLYIVWGTFPPF